MSDTATVEQGTKRSFDVNYTLEIVDELPEGGRPGGFGQSPLEVQLGKVRAAVEEDEAKAGKWMLIGRYGKATAAGAAANVLRQRHGRDMTVEGFEFANRPLSNESGERGLFVRFDPSKVVDGAKAEHERMEAERLARLEAKRAERKGASNGATGAEDSAAPTPAEKAQAAAKKAAAKG